MREEEFRKRYQSAFSSIRTDHEFDLHAQEETMTNKQVNHNRRWLAVPAAAAVLLAGTTVYAQNIGGIQRKMQIWLDGELTTATVDLSDEGSYTIHDSSGNEVESGGGVAYEGLLNHERPLTTGEMAEEIANRITLDERDGKYILYWHDKKVDVTNDFGEDGYAYLTLVDGSDTLYVTINKDGSYSTSPDRYMVPGKDFETN